MLTAYTLDRQDRIVGVTDGWDDFALANDGPAACASHVVGSRLVDSITGDPVRMFMTAILMRVRASGRAETVPYRCDSDSVKRHYTMTLEPLPEGSVRVMHSLDREEAAPISIRIRPAARGESARLRCSICCRIREDGVWRDPFDSGADREVRVIHTICDDCKRSATAGARPRAPRPIRFPTGA